MARKQIKTVYLERQPHRDKHERLRRAYQLLIVAVNQIEVTETDNQPADSPPPPQEVKK